MGREIKRVAAGFTWPLNKIWDGYINPHYQHQKRCTFCDGSGYNPATKKISDDWYAFDESEYIWIVPGERRYNNKAWSHHITQDEVEALVKKNRLIDFTHTWTPEKGWVEKDPPYMPTAEEVNAWSIHSLGHDSLNHWICVETRAKRLGVYGKCDHCKGEGHLWRTPEDEKAYEAWEKTHPPAGDWYQVWETVSEGSPISPAFENPEDLGHWLVDNNASAMGKDTATYEQWMKFILGDGWTCSMVMKNGKLMSGVVGMP